jgi:hypothetical protein
MALTANSLFLYGLQVTESNRSIDFKAASGGPELQATLTLGYYSLTGLLAEVKRAMEEADPANTYTASADRTISSGTQNRVTILTSGSFLSLLFASGTRAASTVAPLLGYTSTDKTGATTYTGSSSAGTVLVSTLVGYNYLPPDMKRKVFGSLNVSATGEKEAIVFQLQQFFQVQFKYEPQATVLLSWAPLIEWMIQQRPLEFTPEITSPSTFIECTLESTSADSKGLAHDWKEMLPNFPFLYDTGVLKFRKKVT